MLSSFTAMMMLEKIKNLFETTNNLGSLAVMIAVERQPFKNFCSNLKVWMSNMI